MRIALDSSVFVGYFIVNDEIHEQSMHLISKVMDGVMDYACASKITIAEMGYVIERKTGDGGFAYNCMHAVVHELGLDIIDVSWEFVIELAHAKAANSISFCDNATITAAKMTGSQAIFSKEKEIVAKGKDKIQGAVIVFLEDM